MAVGAIEGIEREPVESSNIRSLGYSPDTRTMAVEFKSGDVFHYSEVDPDLALEFYAAESKGQFYSSYIKYKKPSRLMTGVCVNCHTIAVFGFACPDCGGEVAARERRRLTPTEKAIEARETV